VLNTSTGTAESTCDRGLVPRLPNVMSSSISPSWASTGGAKAEAIAITITIRNNLFEDLNNLFEDFMMSYLKW
jgi:hypothetical protein